MDDETADLYKKTMSNRTVAICFLVVLGLATGCMSLPAQPPLIEQEKHYFKELEEKCKCRVTRYIDPRDLSERINHEPSMYLIKLDRLPSGIVERGDSLKVVAGEIAKKLHKDVLGKDFHYPYKQIAVVFETQSGQNAYNTSGFDFEYDNLK
jgi:hypothetical protein